MCRLEVSCIVWHDGQLKKQPIIDLSLQYSSSTDCKDFPPNLYRFSSLRCDFVAKSILKHDMCHCFSYLHTHMNFTLHIQWLCGFDWSTAPCSLKYKWNFPISQSNPLINEIVSSQEPNLTNIDMSIGHHTHIPIHCVAKICFVNLGVVWLTDDDKHYHYFPNYYATLKRKW